MYGSIPVVKGIIDYSKLKAYGALNLNVSYKDALLPSLSSDKKLQFIHPSSTDGALLGYLKYGVYRLQIVTASA
jgi:hypothetical protein